ncbi:Potassium channel KOR2 [Acorus calamus]|uniref:Potassium channel n=1 Tax=Acorus calamus TaxID=4465 RepID=A0AAV9DHL2_ACOCL|nr:Potassium channel KOR2 [Acorus calamus]
MGKGECLQFLKEEDEGYAKGSFALDALGCIPWDIIYKVTRLNEECFLPGEVILEQGTAVDQLYIVSYGCLEEVVGEDGLEECVVEIEPHNVIGEHLAASRGYEDITRFLIKQGANVNCIDKFGNSPLLEAINFGHDRVSKILIEHAAILNLEDPGSYLCKVVKERKIDVLRRFLQNGVDPNCKNYDLRTPLHVAAVEGLHIVAKILIEFGANVLSEDRDQVKGG